MVRKSFRSAYLSVVLGLIIAGAASGARAYGDGEGPLVATTDLLFAGLVWPRDDFRIYYERFDILYGDGLHAVDPWRDVRLADYRDLARNRPRTEWKADSRRNINPCTHPQLFWPPSLDCWR